MRKKENILFRTGEKESRASAAVVIINKSENWKENEAIVIRLKARSDDIKDQIDKAFIMELIAILAATQILNWFNHLADITTDCKGAMDKLNHGYIEAWANNGQAQILKTIYMTYKQELKWTRSHPEIRKNTNQYDKNDFGIAMADAACESTLENNSDKRVKELLQELKHMKIHHYEMDVEDVLKEMLKVNDFLWTRNGIPIINTIQSMREVARRDEYLQKRDMWNKDANGNERNIWKCTAIEHGGAINRAKGIRNRIIATKMQYDWEEHGRNRAKQELEEYEAEIAGRCRECGIQDSQYHIIIECITKRLTDIRIETDARIDLYIKGKEDDGENVTFHYAVKNFVENSIRSEKLRLGMWEQRDIEKLSELTLSDNILESELNYMRGELGNMNAIYYQGCRKIIREKKRMDWEDRNPNMKKKKKKGNLYRKEYGSKRKKGVWKEKDVNSALKYRDDLTEADLAKRSNRTVIKKKKEVKKRKTVIV